MNQEKLVTAIERRRGDTSIVEFAESIGMNPSHYYRILKGERGIGRRSLERIIARYPELGPFFLVSVSTTEEDNSPDGDLDQEHTSSAKEAI